MIVWLASYPRSGNTLLRTILLRCFGLNTYSLYDDLTDIGARPQLSSVVGHLNHGLDKRSFYERAVGSNETYFVKTHDAPWDDGKAIYILRDGRSAIVSYYHYVLDFCPSTKRLLEDIIMGDCLFGSWSDHYEAWMPGQRPNTLLLRYDDLVRNPRKCITTISEFIKRPVIGIEVPSFRDLKAVDSNFFRRGDDANNIEELKGEELDLFWLMHGQLMSELGYAPATPRIDALVQLGCKVRRYLLNAREIGDGLQERVSAGPRKEVVPRGWFTDAGRLNWLQFRKMFG